MIGRAASPGAQIRMGRSRLSLASDWLARREETYHWLKVHLQGDRDRQALLQKKTAPETIKVELHELRDINRRASHF